MRWNQRHLRVIDGLFRKLERKIALISRCQPRNAQAEQHRLLGCLRRGAPVLPHWTYAAVPELSDWRTLLAQVYRSLSETDPVERLYLQRADELHLETRLVEAVGTRQFRALSARRFSIGSRQDTDGAELLMRTWLSAGSEVRSGRVLSCDESNPASLLLSMRRTVGQLKLPIRVELSDSLTAAAATGDGTILVARGRRLSDNDVRRIVLHEVMGHAAPRHRASQEALGLFAVGSCGGNDEQEGYALFLEQRAGVMDNPRRVELARRHRAAVGVRQGADWVETARELLQLGADVDEAASIASRVLRAGGLAREFVYLPALTRVARAIEEDATTEEWLARGRLSLEAIATLRGLEMTERAVQVG